MNLDQFRFNIKATVRKRLKHFPLKIGKEEKYFRAMIILSSEKVDYNLSDNYNRGQARPAINPAISGLSCHGCLQMWRTRSV